MFIHCLKILRLSIAALTLVATGAWAQTFIGIHAREANMRSGPGSRHAVQWSLSRGYPLQVVARRGEWLQVRDFERDTGWVHRSLTGPSTHRTVTARVANLRMQPRQGSRVAGKLAYGDMVRVLERRGEWVRVRQDNRRTGWVARRLLWGG